MDQVSCVLENGFASILQVVGLNYRPHRYEEAYQRTPQRLVLGSETASTVSSRGVYLLPALPDNTETITNMNHPNGNSRTNQCSSYDLQYCPWSNLPDDDFRNMDDYPWTIGQFVWTGFDYIGEPIPYGWPARSSYFGIVDLAGFPKDIYYMYQSVWRTDVDVLHLFPHWNWNEGETVDVWAYYNNADCVELFLNGRSLGERRKLTFEEAESGRCPETCGESHPSSVFGSQTAWRSMSGVTDGSTEFHVRWRIPFEPGELKAVAKKDGRAVRETVVRTAGEPASLRLIPDRTSVSADGSELCFVSVEVLDKDGSLCPKADNLIRFEVSGPAEIAGVDNGSPISLERFKSDRRHAMYGKALVILRPAVGKAGKVTLRAVSDNGSDRTMSAETIIKVR